MDRAFELWEKNSTLKPEERLSKRQIAMKVEVLYTTVCERLSGRRGGGCKGNIAGENARGVS